MIKRIVELYHYRELIRNLVIRDLKVRYKNSVLGILWSLLNPLLMTIVFTVVFTLLLRNDTPNYPVFFMCGYLPWSFLSESVMGGTNSIVGNAHLIKKVYFPREVLPLSDVLSGLVNFLLALIVLFGMLLVFRVGLTASVLLLPVIIVAQVLFTLGLVFFLSTANVFYRDTQHIMQVVMQAWFFLTPIFYPIDYHTGKRNCPGYNCGSPNVGPATESDGFTDRFVPGHPAQRGSAGIGFSLQNSHHLPRGFCHRLPDFLPL